MSVFLAPIGNGFQFFTQGNLPLNNGKINTYLAGTVTPLATFTTQAGNVQSPQPIILDQGGRVPQEIWLTGGIGAKFVLTDAQNNVIATYDNLYGINDLSAPGGSFATTQPLLDASNSVATDLFVQQNITGRNKFTNPNMLLDQRNVGGLVTLTNVGDTYTLDRWASSCSLGGGTGTMTVQRINNAAIAMGNPYALSYAVTVAKSVLAATDFCRTLQRIEGANISDWQFGGANAKTFTLSFTFVTNIASAVLPISFQNGANNRSYVTTITTGPASIPARYQVTVPGDQTGTWAIDYTSGLQVGFGFALGSNFSTSANAWGAGNLQTIAGATNFTASVANTWQLTDPQIELGNTASQVERLSVGQQKVLAERCFEKSFPYATVPAQNSGSVLGAYTFVQAVGASTTQAGLVMPFHTAKRATPTVTGFNPSAANAQARNPATASDCSATTNGNTSEYGIQWSATTAVGSVAGQVSYLHWTADCEL